MKKEKLITIGLSLILIVAVVWAISSLKGVKERLELKGENQWTMQLDETELAAEEVSDDESEEAIALEESVYVEEQIAEEQMPEEEPLSEEEPAQSEPEGEITPPTDNDPEAPVLRLESDTITISAGDDFDVISVVDEITDDKDDPIELFRHIRIGGEYDVNTPGEYKLEYIVTDLDGNDSASVFLTLTVE